MLVRLQLGGTALFAHKLQGAERTLGTFATVIGLLSIFHLQAQLTLYAVEVDVVRIDQLWPRGLRSLVNDLTTEADYRAYRTYAERKRFAHPDQEQVHVSFPDRPEHDSNPDHLPDAHTDPPPGR